MTEEIIIKVIEDMQRKRDMVGYCDYVLDSEKAQILLDYITNLQQLYENALKVNQNENKYRTELESKYVLLQQDLDKANDTIQKDRQFYKCRMDEYVELKKENQTLKELNICVGCENNPNYKLRCLKAIEEINYWGIDKEHNDNSAMRLALGNILNILNGSDTK